MMKMCNGKPERIPITNELIIRARFACSKYKKH